MYAHLNSITRCSLDISGSFKYADTGFISKTEANPGTARGLWVCSRIHTFGTTEVPELRCVFAQRLFSGLRSVFAHRKFVVRSTLVSQNGEWATTFIEGPINVQKSQFQLKCRGLCPRGEASKPRELSKTKLSKPYIPVGGLHFSSSSSPIL